ncbi:hypothetical protein [Planococcus soli]|uniref:hypothetical protein n=1 Tax=Planococcus soli TaxID=2666072 RepID=UPI00115E32D1|nr:hypothetical protein [Planococcus soli]
MLNNQQREFRKKIKSAENKKEQHHDIYSYRDQRFTNEKPRKRKKQILQVGGAFGMILLLWNVFAFSTYFAPNGEAGLLSKEELEVHQYIEKNSQVEMELAGSISMLVSLYNDNLLSSDQIEEVRLQLLELQQKMETTDERFIAMHAYTDEQFNLAYQMANVLKLGNSEATNRELAYIIEQQNKLLERRDEVLLKLLANEGMTFEQLEDGSISYEYGL